MQEGYNKPSFGIFLVRVIIISLAIFLFGFIVWGAFKLAGDSGVWSTVFRVAIVVGIIGLIVLAVRFLLRFLAANSITLNFARILGILLGVILIGLIAWGVFRLADTSSDDEYEEVVSVEDENNSSITLDAPDSEGTQDDSSSTDENGGASESGVDEPAAEDGTTTTPPAANEGTPNTGPTPTTEDLPNTGIETSILSLISVGLLAYAAKSYHLSRKHLNQF